MNKIEEWNARRGPGIYEIQCEECDKWHVGQTKRNIDIRFKETHKKMTNLLLRNIY